MTAPDYPRLRVTPDLYGAAMSTESWPAWDAPELKASNDSPRVARYRLHQSWYREHVLHAPPGERPNARGRLVGDTLERRALKLRDQKSASTREMIRCSSSVTLSPPTRNPSSPAAAAVAAITLNNAIL